MRWLKYSEDDFFVDLVLVDRITGVCVEKRDGKDGKITALTVFLNDGRIVQLPVLEELIPAAVEALGLGEALGEEPPPPAGVLEVLAQREDARRYRTLKAMFGNARYLQIYRTPQGVAVSDDKVTPGEPVVAPSLDEVLDRRGEA